MICGIIDMGTNTFNLLIAKDVNQVLHQEKIAVRLGKGGISKGIISPDAIDRAIEALNSFCKTMTSFGVVQIYTTATSAVRSAGNQIEFLKTVKEKTGLDVTVLSGSEEANLIHQGVTQFVNFGQDTVLIVDIGGGSIEFIIADQQEVKWLRSYEIGGQRLIDQFHKSDPIALNEIAQLNQFLDDTIQEVFDNCQTYGAKYLIGSSGSFDTFWDMLNTSGDAPTKPTITLKEFESLYQLLVKNDRVQRLAMPGMIAMRVDMIVGAAVVTKKIIDRCGFDLIKISPFALKEGVLTFGLPKRK